MDIILKYLDVICSQMHLLHIFRNASVAVLPRILPWVLRNIGNKMFYIFFVLQMAGASRHAILLLLQR